jgi:hypothetical protein
VENLDRAVDCQAEFFLKCNAMEQVNDALAQLWELRDKRQEEEFGEVVNLLQNVLAGRNVDGFTPEHLRLLRDVFVRLRNEAAWDEAIANDITLDLLKGGIDAFRELD